ncbi:CLUMA_CG005169, isoform A [Clunio marinus]|uniref:CLUMA_CG005169, isoform A n=1 Tax=Clunio marinus TaxID=568069 RepID=A0A1J1HU29_9DIPT|nr:CLUMA_CG005169, isoform A [Clunio marinus]
MTMSKELGKLEEEALKRKERLKNLKRKFDDQKTETNGDGQEKPSEIPKPMFRNYKKDDEKKITDDLKLPDVAEIVQDQLEEMKEPLVVNDIDISNLAPRKVDFDLKRAINKKLQKLERKTQKAIGELIRERLDKQDDLLEQVNIGAQESQQQNNDEDSD